MSKNKTNRNGYLRKPELAAQVTSYFESHQGQAVDIKTLFRELSLKNHPLKLLCMDVLDELVMDDFIKEVAPMRYQTAAPTLAMEGTRRWR